MIDTWLTYCHLAGGAYYRQQLGMFSLLMNMSCHFACRAYYSFAWYMSTHKLSLSVFCILKIYSHRSSSIIIAKSFGNTFFATTSFQFVSWRVCIMAGARAGAIVQQQQRQCQSLMRMRKGEVSSKNMYMTWLPIRGATKWNTADWSDGACRGVCMSARGAMKWDKAERSEAPCMSVSKVKYRRPIGWGMQRDTQVCQRSDKVKYGRPI